MVLHLLDNAISTKFQKIGHIQCDQKFIKINSQKSPDNLLSLGWLYETFKAVNGC